MAGRYWVGGTGTWDNVNTANWAASTGGPGGQSVPTINDDVYFTTGSGTSSDTVTVSGTINCFSIQHSASNGVVLSLGSSTISLTRCTFTSGSKLVSGTSTLNFRNGFGACVAYSNTGTLAFYDLTFTASIKNTAISIGSSAANISCRNITFSNSFVGSGISVVKTTNITASGTFTANGSSIDNRIQFVSGIKTGSTLSAPTVSISYVDFASITGSGGGSWSGSTIGKGCNCTNISTTAPNKTVYWNNPAGGDFFGNFWAATSGGAVSTANFPIPGDVCVIDNAGTSVGTTIQVGSDGIPGSSSIIDNAAIIPQITASSLSQDVYIEPTNTTTTDETCLFFKDSLIFGSSLKRRTTPYGKLRFYTQGTNTNTFSYSGSTSLSDTAVEGYSTTMYIGGRIYEYIASSVNTSLLNNLYCYNLLSFDSGTVDLGSNTAQTQYYLSVDNTPVFTSTGGKVSIKPDLGFSSMNIYGTGSTTMPLEIQSGTGTVIFPASIFRVKSFSTLGKTTLSSSYTLYCYGDFYVDSGATLNTTGSPVQISTSSGVTSNITINQTFPGQITCTGTTGGTVTLGANLTMPNYYLTVSSGTFNTGVYNVSAGAVVFSGAVSSVAVINMGTGTWTVSGNSSSFTATASAYLTINRQTSTINMTAATAKNFVGGGYTYGTLNQGGAGNLTVYGSNRFANLTVTSRPSIIRFEGGTTQTCDAFNVSGTSGNLVTLQATTTAGCTLTTGSTVTVNVNYLNISYSNATGGTWFAGDNSTDGGNNTGWIFRSASIGGLFLWF